MPLIIAAELVKVVDRMFFGDTLGAVREDARVKCLRQDIRWLDGAVFDGVDAVIDLAALSNDPSGDLDPEMTLAINHRGRARVARLAKEHGVRRYIVASSCSVYGFQEGILNELSTPNPLTTYAQANIEVEKSNLPLADDTFCVTVLRFATLYGLSPRMRFDLAINGMTLGIWEKGTIPVLRDGTQWRPMVHVRDAARAFVMVLQADTAVVNGQTFGAGSDDQNVQILPLAERLATALGKEFKYEWYGLPDHRSYRVSFEKIHKALGFEPKFTPEDAAREIALALEEKRVVPDMRTRTVEWYKNLLYWHGVLSEVVLNDVVL